jgi:hypothetical protein
MSKMTKGFNDVDSNMADDSSVMVHGRSRDANHVPDHVALAWANFDAKASYFRELANGFEHDFGRDNLVSAVVPSLERKLSRLENEAEKIRAMLSGYR